MTAQKGSRSVLVTGATGFLGAFLVKRLRAQGHLVMALGSRDCDLSMPLGLFQSGRWNDQNFDAIFHLAAWTQAGDFCLKHPGEQWIINQRINTGVLTWWHERQPKAKLISIGTSCAYDPALPLTEDNYLRGEPIADLFVYAMTKRMVFTGQRSFAKQFGSRYLCVVPSTLYGPGYHTDGRQMHFIFDLIRKILLGKTQGAPVRLWGDGYQKRELVYIDDFVDILMHLESTQNDELFNVGAGQEHTIREFAQLICQEVGYDFAKVEFDTGGYVGARSKCLDVSKARAALGDKYRIRPLEAGLRETIAWFRTAFSG